MSASRTPTSIHVVIDGTAVTLAPGHSLAAALALLPPGCSRTSVTGERRAPFCGMGICHECRVLVDGHRRLACQTLCTDGMVVDTEKTPPKPLRGSPLSGLRPEGGAPSGLAEPVPREHSHGPPCGPSIGEGMPISSAAGGAQRAVEQLK